MAGRHRATRSRRRTSKASSWVRPAALGTVAASALALTVYATSGLLQGEDTLPAAMAMSADPAHTSPPASSSSSPTPSTTTEESTSSTSPPEPTETTESTETTDDRPPEPTEPPPPEPETCSTELADTEPHVAQVGNHVLTQFVVDEVGGRAGRANASDHPGGLALDLMVSPAVGDELAEYLLAHQAEFGITYVIWEQRINSGSGWSAMEDRGSATANHLDHVHVSFAAGADVSVTC